MLHTALDAWRRYLDANAGVQDYPSAEVTQRPLLLRHRCTLGLVPLHYCPRVVSPLWALNWARAEGLGGRAGTGSVLTFSLMAEALDFMGAPRVTTFRPLLDDKDRRRRDGFWRLDSELVSRLRQAAYVPALVSHGPGRRRLRPQLEVTPRRRPTVSTSMTLTLIRHLLQMRPVTVVMETAIREARPLAVRPRGRAPAAPTAGVPVHTDFVVVSTTTVAAHAQESADFLGIALPTPADIEQSLLDSELFEPVRRFTALDVGPQRDVTGWWRVPLAPLGMEHAVDRHELRGELNYWLRARERDGRVPGAAPAERAELLTERGPVLDVGPDVDPDWLQDPEYRDLMGLPPLDGNE